MFIIIIFRSLEFIIQNWLIISMSILCIFIASVYLIMSPIQEYKPHKSVETQTDNQLYKMDINLIST